MQKNKRLTKSTNIILTGSLAGIAEYIGVDPTIIRLAYLALSFFGSSFYGIILYIVLTVLMPKVTNKKNHDYNYYD